MRKAKYIVKTRNQIIARRILVYTILLVILLVAFIMCMKSFKKVEAISQVEHKTETQKTNEKVAMEENKNIINVRELIKKNTEYTYKKTLDVDEVDLDFTTEYMENQELPTGTIRVTQEGVDGTQMMIIVKTYKGNEYIGEERIQGQVTANAINKVVEIGTGEGVNNYIPKRGDSIWATPEYVKIREAPSRKASELYTMGQNDKAVIMEVVNNNWLKIQHSNVIGYVDSACFTNINPNGPTSYEFTAGIEYSKEELLASVDFNMDLSKPSGLSLAQFQKILSGNTGDTQSVLASNAEFFYYAERQYGINGVYLASMAIHEGGWGTSKIANDKKNLFGYGAYDSNPYGGASTFSTYAEGIDLVARVLVKNYLHPKGTEIYDGQIASGMYYNGPTLTGVNTRYATDKNWANAVFKWMTYLYNRL